MDTQVYRGKPELVHIPDGERAAVGKWVAGMLSKGMRVRAVTDGQKVATPEAWDTAPLCPGCYMVAIFNAAVALAKDNGQSLTELGRSMACAFDALAKGGADEIESIQVKLDGDGDVCELVSNGNG